MRRLPVASVFPLFAFAVLTISCSDRDHRSEGAASDDEPLQTSGERTTLECVALDYPCTWGEVEPDVLERTQALAEEGNLLFQNGDDATNVAEWLETQSGIGQVLHDEHSVRFWLERGRPVWLLSPELAQPGMMSASPLVPPTTGLSAPQGQAQKADPVGRQSPGTRPIKNVLQLDPYRWEFKLPVLLGPTPLMEDEAIALPSAFRGVRDYQCTPGRFCPCPQRNCVEYVGNTWRGNCDLADTLCAVDINVTREHFKSWRLYDVVHVATHGVQSCDPSGNNCASALASGRMIRGDIKDLADAAKVQAASVGGPVPQWADWLTETGVELVPIPPLNVVSILPPVANPKHCKYLIPGTPGYRYGQCDTGLVVWREYLGMDFFKKAYGPGDLKDKLIFLNACESMATTALADYLAGPSNESTVVGWENPVVTIVAQKAVGVFYREWVKGKTAHEAFQAVAGDPQFQSLKPQIFPALAITQGDAAPPNFGPATYQSHGLDEKRGAETVRLYDPSTGIEVVDGGSIPLFTQPGDGQPDTLDALIEVVSVDPDESPDEFVLRVRVDGQDAPQTAVFNLDRGNGTHRYRGSLDLGFDLTPGRPVDVEVSADLPAGGETRWLYYDMTPDVCIVPRQGTYAGQLGGTLARQIDATGRGGFAKILRSPLGGWGLQIENRESGRDLNFLIAIPDDPTSGASTSVVDLGLADFKIGGGVRSPEEVRWASGSVQIDYKAIRPQPGKPFTWVCGTLSANLIGHKAPPPGSMTPVRVPATFSGQFWAEWYPNR